MHISAKTDEDLLTIFALENPIKYLASDAYYLVSRLELYYFLNHSLITDICIHGWHPVNTKHLPPNIYWLGYLPHIYSGYSH